MLTEPMTTPAAVDSAAARWPDHPAIVDEQWDAPVALTWAELADRIRAFACALVECGVHPGDRVAIWAPNSHHWPVAALGTHYVGGVLVPLNTRYTITEAASIIERSNAGVVIAAGSFAGIDRLGELLAASVVDGRTTIGIPLKKSDDHRATLSWADATSRPDSRAISQVRQVAESVSPNDLSDILFTSGTTGSPKGVLAEHRHTLAGARAWGTNGSLAAIDRYLMVNPYFHTFGYKAGIVASALAGTTMFPLAVYSPAEAMRMVAEYAVTVFPGAPTIFQTILDDPHRSEYDLSSLRLVVTGATVVPVVLIERLQSELGVDTVITAYGQTETSGFITTCRPDDDAATVATTCGRAFDGMQIRLAENGEVLARGKMVMRGYLDDPRASAEAIDADGWLHTGDIGALDDCGNLIITDRLKDMFICGGFNVYPAEVEQTLVRVPGVTEAAVIGVPDARLGEVGHAFLTRLTDTAVTSDEVLSYARAHLAGFKVPRRVVFVDEFPRNAAGKILKRELR